MFIMLMSVLTICIACRSWPLEESLVKSYLVLYLLTDAASSDEFVTRGAGKVTLYSMVEP